MFSIGETMEFLLGNPFSTPVGQRIGKSQQRVFEVLQLLVVISVIKTLSERLLMVHATAPIT